MKVERSIEISAPPERVWPYLVEPDKILEWCITIRKFGYIGEQRVGPGAQICFEEEAAGRLMKMSFLVTDWVENEKIAFHMIAGDFLKAYAQSWTLQEVPGGSRFTFMEEIELPYGIIGQAIGLVARHESEATVEKMLSRLKELAEARVPVAV